jgi:hypothetical protein
MKAKTMSYLTKREQYAYKQLRKGGKVWNITATEEYLHTLNKLRDKGLVVFEPRTNRNGDPMGGDYRCE